VSDAAWWKQELVVGAHVLLDAEGSHESPHLIDCQVVSLDDQNVVVRPERRCYFIGAADEFYFEPIFNPHQLTMPRSHFETSPAEHAERTRDLWAKVVASRT
jgi:hypothetical protein